MHQPLDGDGSLTVRVTSLTGVSASSNQVAVSPNGGLLLNTNPALAPWAKAGVIIQKDTSLGSAYAAVMVTGSHGVRMQYNYTHDAAGSPGSVTVSSPRWLRLTRAGDVITGYDSTDGTHWSEIGSAQLSGLPSAVQVGMFVTSPVYFAPGSSHGYPSEATASFDQIAAGGDLPQGAWTGEAIGSDAFYPSLPLGLNWHQQPDGAFTVIGSGDIGPQAGGGAFGSNAGASLLIGALAGLIVLIILGTLFITSEYRRGLIRTTLTASPRRGRVLAAKAIVIGSVAFVAGVAGTAVSEVVSRHVLAANGNYLLPLSAASEVRVIVGTGLLLAAAAVLALALGAALRRSAGAVVGGIVLIVLPFILGTTLPPGPSNWLMRLTPTAAFAVQGTQPRFAQVSIAYSVANGYYPLSAWAGLAVLCGYAAVALAGAIWLLRRRDV
ncbi:MAG TPA: ABC transporter permease subunit [Acidimicrobiales bacterium]|nr:ABC transporter permease subunit [Acidimicrobiales bacterium]